MKKDVTKGQEDNAMMIQDIGPHRLRNQYSERTESGPDSPVFVFMGPKLLIKENTEHYFEQKAWK